MKSKKVLLGLILAAFVGTSGIAMAQIKANSNKSLIEIGPDNIGGRVRSLALVKNADNEDVLYAGGVAGGLYKRTTGAWEYIPYIENGKEITLPISYLVSTPNDNNIIIATGEGMAVGENANSAFIVPKGRGLFRFNPANNEFTAISATTNGGDWTYINKMAYLYRDNYLYFYVATNGGLFRWKIGSASDWNSNPEKIHNGPVQDVEVISNDNMAFFTSGSHLYKVGNVTAQSTPIDISATNSAFGGDALRIELAGAHSDKTYLYAVVTDANGLLDGVYLTNDQQNWTTLASRTVTPFTSINNGWHSSSITIDPQNHKRIFVGGASVWVGEGFVEGSYYQWNKASYTENELNYGDYMGSCYSNSLFCHSGIHEILPFQNEWGTYSYYIATDGGVYQASNRCQSYSAVNKGFNTVQFNDFAIAPDGSIIGGAMDNACPFIQSRNAHYGGNAAETWYSNPNDLDANRNSIANILWFGNGGQTASSMFQQVLPLTRRGIFVSSNGSDFAFTGGQGVQQAANFGRAFNDYSDYTNTQTWTSGERFLGDAVSQAHDLAHMTLWETNNSTIEGDNVTLTMDTLGYVKRGDTILFFSSKHYFKGDTVGFILTRCTHTDHVNMYGQPVFPVYDTTFVTSAAGASWAADFQIKAGDVYTLYSKKHFSYPFPYTFTSAGKVINSDGATRTITTHNPIASRIFVNGMNQRGIGVVYMNMTPSDYSKVWDYATASEGGHTESLMNWFNIYKCKAGYQPGVMAVSNDGDALFMAIEDTLGQSMIVRCSNLLAADPANVQTAQGQLNYEDDYEGMSRITLFDTIFLSNGNYLFDRPITSISVDPRSNNDAIVITFGGEGESANVLYVNNANNKATRTVTAKTVDANAAALSSCIVTVDPTDAAHTAAAGTILVGTINGAFSMAPNASNWAEYGAFAGVPVTAIHQQVKNLEEVSYVGHTGVNAEQYLFASTKFPYAVYVGTYGRGIFMDRAYVIDTVNDIINDRDYNLLDIPTVENKGNNTVAIYPNPASDYATVDLTVYNAGRATMKVYDLSGKVVMTQDLGMLDAGVHNYRVNVQNFRHGMYLVNVILGNQTATSKLIVR